MRFTLSEQQTLIEDSALDFLTRTQDPGHRRYGNDADPLAPRLWPAFAEMGWLGLPLPEACGGFGGGAMDTGLLMRAFGRHGVNAPYHSGIVLAARLLAELGTVRQRAQWLPAIVDGERRIALAHDEPQCHSPWAARHTHAVREGTGWRLHGVKLLVAGGPGAHALLVSARMAGTDPGRHALFLLPLSSDATDSAAGLRLQTCRMADGAMAADVCLDGVRVGDEALLGVPDSGAGIGPIDLIDHIHDSAPALHRILAEGLIALCWEACGAMQAALNLTVSHTSQREQFGRTIASFQVVQHRLAEMAVCCEEAQAACELAAMRVDGGAPGVLAAASMAKSKVGRAARFVAQEAVQLHGAMGVSEALPVASLFRKLTQFQQQGGATAWHSAQLGARLLGSGGWRDSQTLLNATAMDTATL
ncbi:putative Acyl-CoA dehydrogenase [Cupriavidus basilensis OR16]|uniref:Putative Acyl-CoA dehydrogenase n=1 Tax=Cupriavidus basilensis OR16 TaxID=1127483 RepID=H1SAY9_9BURK|nr:acyl-CoA dehydrogenase family protein [Cupriavidus basilensis]EHP40321.1 putative Acyl-CoA dehydrogenase [Cupriavidus basilensis OR16]